jgi:hypothetical protein
MIGVSVSVRLIAEIVRVRVGVKIRVRVNDNHIGDYQIADKCTC